MEYLEVEIMERVFLLCVERLLSLVRHEQGSGVLHPDTRHEFAMLVDMWATIQRVKIDMGVAGGMASPESFEFAKKIVDKLDLLTEFFEGKKK
jgi:hypothetical protein